MSKLSLIDKAKKYLEKIKTAEEAVALSGKEREQYLKSLDLVHGPKDKRAADMGFGKQTWYHGGPEDLSQLKPSKAGSYGPGVYVTDSAGAAEQYADRASGKVYDLRLRDQSPINFDDFGGHGGIESEMTNAGYDDLRSWLKHEGATGIEAHGSDTVGKERTVLDPSQIRATQAAFDPRFKDSAKIMAGAAPAAMPTPDDVSPIEYAKSLMQKYRDAKGAVADKVAERLDVRPHAQTPSSRELMKTIIETGGDPLNFASGGAGVAAGAADAFIPEPKKPKAWSPGL